MLAYPCPVCCDYGCTQHGWCYMDDSALLQTLLKGFEEMLRRSSNASASYAGGMDAMDSPLQYINLPAYPPMVYPPLFNANAAGLSGAKDVDALADRMQNAYISPPAYSADIWAAQGGTSAAPHYPAGGHTPPYQVASEQGVASSPEYDYMLARWPESYASVPQDAEPRGLSDEDISYTEQHVNVVEPPPVPTHPGPVPSISVIEHLEQGTYPRKQPVKGTPAGPIYFNGGLGVSCGSLAALADGGEPAFDAAATIGEKASIRFMLPQFSGHSIQVRMRHGDQKGRMGRPVTMREMGETVFAVLRKLMNHGEDRGEPLRHGGLVVDIERVVLLRVDHISRGSIQPLLGIRKNG